MLYFKRRSEPFAVVVVFACDDLIFDYLIFIINSLLFILMIISRTFASGHLLFTSFFSHHFNFIIRYDHLHLILIR